VLWPEHSAESRIDCWIVADTPAEQPFEAAVSYSSWDTFFYTRQFRSVDSDQSMRHVSKVLTYPITIASVLHQNGPYTYGNGRITAEGRRSMAGESCLTPSHTLRHLKLSPLPMIRGVS
jgi:splicing suppressor protein 51